MTLYKRGNVYWYNFVRDGRRFQASTGCRRKADAEVIENAKKVEIAKEEVGIKPQQKRGPAPRFDAAMVDFLKWCEVEHADKPSTTRRYKVSSKALVEYFKQIRIDRIDTTSVEDFKDWRRVQKVTPKKAKARTSQIMPATVNRELACLRAMFFYWIRKKAILSNPVSDVKMLAEKQSFHVISPEEEHAYFAEASDPLHDIASLILETGMRPEEVYTIKPGDIRLKEGYYFNSKGKTPSARRRVPLTQRAQQLIAARLAHTPGEILFPGRVEGRPIVKINAAHTAAIRRAKLPKFRLYDFRHTFATRFVEAGGDLVTLAQILGHSDLRMVMVYSHPTDPHKQQSIQKLEAYNADRRKNVGETLATVFATQSELGEK